MKEQHQTIVSLKSMSNKLVQNNTNDFDIQKLFKKLNDDNASLIEYFVGQNTIYSFEISNKKIRINTI